MIKLIKRGSRLEILPDDYCLLDIETTGLNPIENEIIEISAYKVRNNLVVDIFSSLVKPNYKISSFITNLTHITNSMVKYERSIDEVLSEFIDFLGDDIVIGHNVTFDLNFLSYNSIKYFNKPIVNNYVDTVILARRLLPGVSHKLEDLSDYFNLDNEGEHRALKDVELTYEVYNIFKNHIINNR